MLKDKLHRNQLSIGSWITIPHPSIVEILLATDRFDWLTIDMEHSAIDIGETQNLIGHIQNHGANALVRVPQNEPVMIKRVLDSGANGVIVPMVNTTEDLKTAINHVYYPPKGRRGVGLARAQGYGFEFQQYQKRLDTEIVLIAQIEHIDGVRNIDAILEDPDLDGIIIGPYDLSGSMGMPGAYHEDRVQSAIKTVEDACKKHEKPLGIHVIPPDVDELSNRVKAGYRFIAFSIDFMFLGSKVRETLDTFTKVCYG